MAVFSVVNGTGLNGAGIHFGLLNIATSGIAGFPIITPTTGSIFFNDTGLLSITGTGMSFIFPSTFGGTVSSLTYGRPAVTPIFSITGMNTPLATVTSLFTGSEKTALAAIFSGDDTISGSSMNDTLLGYAGADSISGGDGVDRIAGGDGVDSINGGAGTDTLAGGADSDTLDGGDGVDIVTYASSAAAVQVDLKNGTSAGGDAAGDSISNVEYLTGSAFDDTLAGTDGANRLLGGGGADVLDGNDGDDALKGGDGADQLSGGGGNDSLSGDADNDVLSGGAGDDRLVGGDGEDSLSDGAGRDAMTGGTGNDTFIFTTLDGNADVIRDWAAGDKIAITFDTGTVTVGELIAGTTFQGVEGEGIFYNTANGRLYLFDSEEGVHTLFGVLTNKPTDLAFSDFLIV